jgi:uncharacterized membrane protein
MKLSIIAILIVLFADLIWLTVQKNAYGRMVKAVQGKSLSVKWAGALVAYACIFLGFLLFVFPAIKNNRSDVPLWKKSFMYGFTFGALAYGMYNGTNYAIFKSYPADVAVMDTLWGGTVMWMGAWGASMMVLRKAT